jgi:zona occludens toxin (predicted ATPase)
VIIVIVRVVEADNFRNNKTKAASNSKKKKTRRKFYKNNREINFLFCLYFAALLWVFFSFHSFTAI